MTKSLIWTLLSRILGFAIFIVLWLTVNVLTIFIHNPMYRSCVVFLNANFFLIILLSVMFMISELFIALPFPLSLPSPLFGAAAGVMAVSFAFRVAQFAGNLAGISLSLAHLGWIVYPLVFIVILISGYASIILDATKSKKRE